MPFQGPRVCGTAWSLLAVFIMPRLSNDSRSSWVRHRLVAQRIVKLDREAGGEGQFDCFQYRLCRVCKRVLIGAAAHEYTEKIRQPRFKWEFPHGPGCGTECAPIER